MTARDLALRTPELLLEIFQNTALKDLLEAALVCKAWSPCATEMIWMTGIMPLDGLMKMLSTRVFSVRGWGTLEHSALVDAIIEEGAEGSWRNFCNELADNVRHIRWRRPLSESGGNVIAALIQKYGTPLCPRLISVNIHIDHVHDDHTHARTLALIAGSSVKKASLYKDWDFKPYMDRCLQVLVAQCPEVEHIHLESPDHFPSFRSFSNLKIVELEFLDQRGWLVMSECPLLDTLRTIDGGDVAEPSDIDPERHVTFPSLQWLAIHNRKFRELVIIILMNTKMPRLRKLDVRLDWLEPDQATDALKHLGQFSPLLESLYFGKEGWLEEICKELTPKCQIMTAPHSAPRP